MDTILYFLIAWNLLITIFLFKTVLIDIPSIDDMVIKLGAGYTIEEIGRENRSEMEKIKNKRGW
jgi:hypothetical protein